jgi:hypothetical protein
MSNDLQVEIYERFSTTRREGWELLRGASIPSFSTVFPGGLYLSATVRVPMDVTGAVPWAIGDRLVLRGRQTIVWEGEISGIDYGVDRGAEQSLTLECTGYWGALLGLTLKDRRWADDRLSAEVWLENTTELITWERNEQAAGAARIKITPKAEQFGTADVGDFKYTMPDGETVGRVSGNYRFAEGAQAWGQRVSDASLTTDFSNITATGTGSFDVDDAAPEQSILFRFYNDSGGNQTPTNADGSTYKANINAVMVYAQPSSDFDPVTLSEVVKDIRADISNLNSDESHIAVATNELTLEPFYTIGPEPVNSILARAAALGDDDDNQWYVRIIDSESSASPDGKPVLASGQFPALTDYEYAVNLRDKNLIPPLNVVKSAGNIRNYIYVKFRHPDGERDIIKTPNDDANLTDATSVADWGQRELLIDAGRVSEAAALQHGYAVLAARKDPQIYVAGPITVQGFIRGKDGNDMPVSEIQAGQRIKVEDFIEDVVGTAGAGLTFPITGTDYDDTTETNRLMTGVPDNLAVMLAQQQFSFT